MMRLSSTRTRRWLLTAEYRSPESPAGAGDDGTSPLTDCRLRPGIVSAPMSSIESIFSLPVLVLASAHWQDSQSGSSILQNLISGSSDGRGAVAPAAGIPSPAETAFSLPVLTVDFSACVAPIERR